jgi:hypothetical protein
MTLKLVSLGVGEYDSCTDTAGDQITIQRLSSSVFNVYCNGVLLNSSVDYTLDRDGVLRLHDKGTTILTDLCAMSKRDIPQELFNHSSDSAHVQLVSQILSLAMFQSLSELDQDKVKSNFIEIYNEIYVGENIVNMTKLKHLMNLKTPFKYQEVIPND